MPRTHAFLTLACGVQNTNREATIHAEVERGVFEDWLAAVGLGSRGSHKR